MAVFLFIDNIKTYVYEKFHSALFDFCWFPNYDASIEYLANNIADPEPWDFSDATQAKYSILKSYIEHTFRKIKSENKISFSSDNNFACFNTGLVTANLESIFALAERNNRPDVAEKGLSPYVFKAFVRESDIQLISKFGDNIPDIADFFQKPEDLIFNPQCRVVPQIDHIIADNMDRFPAHMQGLSSDEMRRRLVGAINEAQKSKVKLQNSCPPVLRRENTTSVALMPYPWITQSGFSFSHA